MLQRSLFQRRWIGRFGNRLHQYAYGASYANLFNVKYQVISAWEGDLLFEEKHHHVIEDDDLRESLCAIPNTSEADPARLSKISEYLSKRGETIFNISPDRATGTWHRPETHVSHDDLCAYHPTIFEGMSKEFLLTRLFRFQENVIRSDIYRRFEDQQGTYDIAHLRRDDICLVNLKSSYPCVSKDSYDLAFQQFGFAPTAMQWSTDDKLKKWGVGSPLDYSGKALGNVYPCGSIPDPEGNVFFGWFPDFLRLYFARTIFRANSSFSFWAAFLSQQRETPAVVYSPRIERKVNYEDPKTLEQELHCKFENGNHPHWVMAAKSKCPNILIH